MASAKVLSRLRKLLALARSGNTHEAASARSKADALMARHALQESDADVAGEDEVVEQPIGAAGFASPWKFKLATVAARRHDCEALGLRVGKRRKVRIVGVRVKVAAAVEEFKCLEQEVRRLARAELSGVVAMFREISPRHVRRLSEKYLLHFREGLVDGLAVLLRRERGEAVRGGASATVGSASTGRGGGGQVSEPREEGLVKVESRGDGVRERLASKGVREVSGEGLDDLDELDEVAYRSGFRQAAGVQVSDEGREP
jgi:hypothetical protein